MTRLLKVLRSPRLALGVLGFLALWCGAAAWYPWLRPGAAAPLPWVVRVGLDRPFVAPPFLVAVLLLFASTLVCTLDRTVRLVALSRGRLRPWGAPLPRRDGASIEAFLRSSGFRPSRHGSWYRFRWALWGGWTLHVGLLALIAGVLVQQGWHDGGAFQLAEGETARLEAPGTVFGRKAGPFARKQLPDAIITLTAFDPFLHQKGYAPDRASRLRLESPGRPAFEGAMDRAEGLSFGAMTVFQAIPSGLAVVVGIDGRPAMALHLVEVSPNRLAADFVSPRGLPVSVAVETENRYDGAAGTGRLRILAASGPDRREVLPGEPFDFGGVPARVVTVCRWGGFTYSLDPGMPAVFAGFSLVLVGAALMTFPSGVALVGSPADDVAAWVWVTRGREVVLSEWGSFDGSGILPGGGS